MNNLDILIAPGYEIAKQASECALEFDQECMQDLKRDIVSYIKSFMRKGNKHMLIYTFTKDYLSGAVSNISNKSAKNREIKSVFNSLTENERALHFPAKNSLYMLYDVLYRLDIPTNYLYETVAVLYKQYVRFYIRDELLDTSLDPDTMSLVGEYSGIKLPRNRSRQFGMYRIPSRRSLMRSLRSRSR